MSADRVKELSRQIMDLLLDAGKEDNFSPEWKAIMKQVTELQEEYRKEFI